MLKKMTLLAFSFLFISGGALASNYVELSSSDVNGIKFKARKTLIGGAYESQLKGDTYRKNLESKNYLSAYSPNYLKVVETYEEYLKKKSEKDEWVQYSPVLSMLYPDLSGQVVIANLQIEVPVFYQAIIFSYDSVADKYEMRDRFVKKIVEKNCERLRGGIEQYDRSDWESYIGMVKNLGNSITFKFKNDVSMTLLSNCPGIDWSEYK